MTFTIDDRNELLKTINYSRGLIDKSSESLMNQIAVKINFGSNVFSVEELRLILQVIGLYLNKASLANSTHMALYHRIDHYNSTEV